MKINLMRLAVLAAFLAFWQFSSGRLVSAYFVSTPTAVLHAFWRMISDGSLFYHAGWTAAEAGLGFLIGGTAGAIVGLAFGRNETLNLVMQPFLVSFFSLPKVALAPLFIMWFGIGFQMKLIYTATIVFFLVFMNTYTGVRNVSRELISIFRLMGAQERHLATKIIVPSAFTWIFAGLRLSVPYALVGAIISEIIASNKGLGYLVQYNAARFDTAGIFAALIGVVALALTLNFMIRVMERRLMPWKAAEDFREVAV